MSAPIGLMSLLLGGFDFIRWQLIAGLGMQKNGEESDWKGLIDSETFVGFVLCSLLAIEVLVVFIFSKEAIDRSGKTKRRPRTLPIDALVWWIRDGC